MKCKFALLATTCAVCVFFTLGVASAQAYIPGVEPINDLSYEPNFDAILDGTYWTTTTGSEPALYPPPDWFTSDVLMADESIGRLPLLTGALAGGYVFTAAAAADIGWKIGRTIDTKWLHLEGPIDQNVAYSGVLNEAWCPTGSSSCSNLGNQGLSASVIPAFGMVSNHDLGYGLEVSYSDCLGNVRQDDVILLNPLGYGTASACIAAKGASTVEWNYATANLLPPLVGTPGAPTATWHYLTDSECQSYADGNNEGSGSSGGTIQWYVATRATGVACGEEIWLEKDWVPQLLPNPLVPFVAQPVGATTTMGTPPPAIPTAAQAAAARTRLENPLYSEPATPDQADCSLDPNDFNCPSGPLDHVSGGHVKTTTSAPTFVPFYLPTPLPGETVDEYTQRLHALFWLGAVSLIQDGAEDSSAAAGSAYALAPDETITRLQVALGPVVTTYDAGGALTGWPTSTMPQVTTSTQTVTIYEKPNPSIFDEPVTPPTGTPVPVDGIDWTPIENLNVGTKFPFGVPTWLQTGVSGLGATGSSCPSLTIPWPSALGSGSSTVSFCSTTWETDYRPWVFLIAEALMTLLAIVWLGSKVIGFGGND